MAIRFRLHGLEAPVYCRTADKQLRRVLFERYGARVLNPTGANADAHTILAFTRTPAKTKRVSAAQVQ